MTEKRCPQCVSAAIDREEAEDIARLQADGWGK